MLLLLVLTADTAVTGKIKSTMLMEVLSSKSRDWAARHHDTSTPGGADDKLESRGLYVLKHRERQCFQLVARADNVFLRCSELLKSAFDGTASDPLSALLVISLASDWDFYYIPVEASGQCIATSLCMNTSAGKKETMTKLSTNDERSTQTKHC